MSSGDRMAKLAALSPEDRQALHARLLARKQQAAAQQQTTNPPLSPPSNTPVSPVQDRSLPRGEGQRNITVSNGTPNSTVTQAPAIRANPTMNVTRTATGPGAPPINPTIQNLRNTAIRPGRGDSLTHYTTPDGTPLMEDPNAGNKMRNLPSRGASERRPSQQVIDKEKKTEYWQDVARTSGYSGGKEFESVISRAMSLGIVGDKKQRESMSAPKTNELLQSVAMAMEQRVTELGGPKLDENVPLMEKIVHLERHLTNLEAKKRKEEEEEKARVQSKISELESSLKNLQAQKQEQISKNRQTMKIEIDSLKEMMTKVQQDQSEAAINSSQAMATKVARLEAALRLLNEERKKETDDKDSLLLKRKLSLFEQKLEEMEAEKKLREESDNSDTLKEKLSLMEDKLAKMERRKSVSQSQELQNKMATVEKQLSLLHNERTNGHNDSINNKIAQKMQLLEKQLHDLAAQKIVVNDPETEGLRSQMSKLEETIVSSEKRMEDQRKKNGRRT